MNEFENLSFEEEPPVNSEKSDPEEEIQRLKLELDEYKDLFLRKAAEFENFKKRKQGEFAALINSAEESLIAELLPVLDDLQRLLQHTQDEQWNREAFLRGSQLIHDKLTDLLTSRGLRPIEAVGTPFNPELHEALLQQSEGGVEPGMVLQEHLRGYRLGDKVLRHTQVVVSA
jgi:molecular chaperone GrpE